MEHCSTCTSKGNCTVLGFCKQLASTANADELPAVGSTYFVDHEGRSMCVRVRGFSWGRVVDTTGHMWPFETQFRKAVERMVGGKMIWCDPLPISPADESYRLNREATVAIATETRCSKDMTTCPRGVKCYLVGQGGVGQLAIYDGDPFWIEWAPVPARAL